VENVTGFQGEAQGLHVRPLPPRKQSTGWKVIKWTFFIIICLVCAASVFFNFLFSAGLSVGGGRSDGVIEKHVSGPGGLTASARIAVVTIDDIIVGTEDTGPAAWIFRQLQHAQDDSKVKVVILDIDSPGGGITASDIVYKKILDLQADGKYVIVLMRDIAASGAYYISAPADEIFAHPTTITGSIGVIISSFNIDGLFQKIGVQSVVFKSINTPYKDLLSPYRPATEEEKAMLQDITEQMYTRFKEIVEKGRGLKPEEVAAVATGAIFTAKDAKDKKLIDSIGYFDDAVEAAKKQVGQVEAEVVRYQKPPTLADVLFSAKSDAEGDLTKQMSTYIQTHQPGFYYLWPGP
jgi:protease-4